MHASCGREPADAEADLGQVGPGAAGAVSDGASRAGIAMSPVAGNTRRPKPPPLTAALTAYTECIMVGLALDLDVSARRCWLGSSS